MKKNNWKVLLQEKLQLKTSKRFDDQLIQNIRAQMKKNKKQQQWVSFKIDFTKFFTPALALGITLFIFITSHNNPMEMDLNNPHTLSSLIEKQELLENLTGFSEIESIEKLSDADWDILLAGAEDV